MGDTKKQNEKLDPSVYVIFSILLFDLLGFTVILPLLPSIFEYYGSNNEDHLYHWMDKKVRYFQNIVGAPDGFNQVLFSGLLGSAFSTLQFLVAPIFGSLSDVYGRKPLLIFCALGIGLSHAVWSVSDHFYLFVIARIIGGLSRANISLATAAVTDVCPEKKRSKGMAFIGIAYGIGFIIGPMIGALFASQLKSEANFYFYPALFSLSMTIIDLVLLVFCFSESLPKSKRAKSVTRGLSEAYQYISPPSLFSFSPVKSMKSDDKRSLCLIGYTYFLFLFIYSGLEYSLSFLTHMQFGFTKMQQGKMYLFCGLIMLLIQGGFVRRIPLGKEMVYAAIGNILIIPAFILIGLSQTVVFLYLGLALYAIASAIVVPCLTTVASRFGTSSQKGTVLGIFRSLGSLARAFGPITSALSYWSLSFSMSYSIGGLLLIVPLLLILNIHRRLKMKHD